MCIPTVPLETARWKLLQAWIVCAAVPFLLLLIQSVQHYRGLQNEIWGWFTPAVLPTLLLMIGMIGGAQAANAQSQSAVSQKLVKYAYILIISYFAVILIAVIWGGVYRQPEDGLVTIRIIGIPLSLVQGIAAAFINHIFSKPEPATEPTAPASPGQPAPPATEPADPASADESAASTDAAAADESDAETEKEKVLSPS